MAIAVNIKMYRVGELGDCFLLCFIHDDVKTHVLIDCGSFRNGKDSVNRMKAIASDVKKQVGTNRLDIIVGTHQHNDHLSGFIHAQKTFKEMNPGQVWLSWLDKPGNRQAQQIGKEYNNYLTTLRLINKQLQSSKFSTPEIKEKVQALLGFYGIPAHDNRLNAKTDKFPPDLPARAREILQKIGKKEPGYLFPGQILNLPGIPGDVVKVYVLGPPKKESQLYDREPGEGETFDPKLAANSTNASRLLAAMKKKSSSQIRSEDKDPYPFDEPYRESVNFDAVWDSYYKKGDSWRKIENDWLNQAEHLALWLDGFTNNSSLVLAFELVKSNKILLFPGDAQSGNWNSWKEIKWNKKPKEFNWLSLMRNTVLYKAGHHGSHNSTLVEALDNMTHKELTVLIPVDKTDPNIKKKKGGWKMPAENLYKELKKRSMNRIIRMDTGISEKNAWSGLPNQPSSHDLYHEYEITG